MIVNWIASPSILPGKVKAMRDIRDRFVVTNGARHLSGFSLGLTCLCCGSSQGRTQHTFSLYLPPGGRLEQQFDYVVTLSTG